jgi:peptide/nickel transport system permease protein
MLYSIVRRLFSVIPILLIVSIILFLMMNVLPGDAAMNAALGGGDDAYISHLREQMGLNRPAYVRYFSWLGDMLRGDMGKSLLTSTPVSTTLKQRLPVTLQLTLLSILISIIIAIPLGILSALKRNSPIDMFSSVFAMFGIAMPSFWLGILLILLFAVTLGWLPASGYVSIFVDPIRNLRLMIMPAFAIGFAFSATIMRQTRSAMLEVITQDYIMTARSKGLSETVIIWKHALRNTLIPVLTVISMHIGRLIGGAVVTEQVFALPGLGRQIVDSILSRDYPVVMALVMVVALAVIMINTFVDVLYIIIDPRISHDKKK